MPPEAERVVVGLELGETGRKGEDGVREVVGVRGGLSGGLRGVRLDIALFFARSIVVTLPSK